MGDSLNLSKRLNQQTDDEYYQLQKLFSGEDVTNNLENFM